MTGYNPRTGLAVTPKDGYAIKASKPRRMRFEVTTRQASPADLARLGHSPKAV